ncbi:MAG: M48 family metallopeptidase [Bacteroidales bacterium]|jgi:heat shock protein HtpX|nr:M48 family metallopeptidase [Bacteroidales bacterium]
MTYIGIDTQIRRNNTRSTVLLFLFPILVLVLAFICYAAVIYFTHNNSHDSYDIPPLSTISYNFLIYGVPIVILAVGLWFVIAYFSNTALIEMATKSHSLERRNNKRIYNLVENLCMSVGMPMPKISVIDDDSLNAFASGISQKTFTVTLTTGIINKLNDEELSGVIAHELTHIRNRDVRVLIVSIVFVGIFTLLSQIAFQMLRYSSLRGNSNKKDSGAAIMLIMLIVGIVALIGVLFSSMMKFAISRNREYMADAGGAAMTKNPLALASALRKISSDPDVESVSREDVAQLFIEYPLKSKKNKSFLSSMFSTHPPINERIRILEQM